VLNASAVRLAALRDGLEGGVYELVETGGEDTVAAYEAFLRDRSPDLVLTGSREGCHFRPDRDAGSRRVGRSCARLYTSPTPADARRP
jgi:hypothetical protein